MGLRRARAVALVLVGVALAGCSSAAGSPPASTTTTTVPTGPLVLENGGTVTVGVSRLPTNFNPSTPAGANDVTAEVMSEVWAQPFTINPTSQPILAGGGGGLLTQGALIGVDPQTVVLTIDPRAHWSDGVPITVADFIYNWHEQVAVGKDLPAMDPLLGYEDIKSITGSDSGRTVTIVFKTPYADWEGLFANLVPAHIARRYGWEKAFAGFDPTRILSAGPFELSRYVPGRELVLERNPHYWGHGARLKRIVFRVVNGVSAMRRALLDGKVDVAVLPSSDALDEAVAHSGDLIETSTVAPVLWQLAFNVADPVLASASMRQAIAKSIDRNQLISNTIGLVTGFGAVSGNRLYLSGESGGQRNDSAYLAADLTEAEGLFAVAGYHLNGAGYLESATHARLVLHIVGPEGDVVVAAMEQQLQAQLLQAGVTLEIHNIAQSKLLADVLPNGNYQLALAPFDLSPYQSTSGTLYSSPVAPAAVLAAGSVVAGLFPAGTLFSTAPGTEPGAVSTGSVTRDILGFEEPAIDSLFRAAASQLNPPSYAGLYNEIDQQLWVDMPTFPLFQAPMTLVTRVDVVNVSPTQTWVGPLWNADQWAIQVHPTPTVPSTTPGYP